MAASAFHTKWLDRERWPPHQPKRACRNFCSASCTPVFPLPLKLIRNGIAGLL
jgi:hypothetical protein